MVVLIDKRRIKEAMKDAKKYEEIELPPMSELKQKKKELKSKRKALKKFESNFRKKKLVYDSI